MLAAVAAPLRAQTLAAVHLLAPVGASATGVSCALLTRSPCVACADAGARPQEVRFGLSLSVKYVRAGQSAEAQRFLRRVAF